MCLEFNFAAFPIIAKIYNYYSGGKGVPRISLRVNINAAILAIFLRYEGVEPIVSVDTHGTAADRSEGRAEKKPILVPLSPSPAPECPFLQAIIPRNTVPFTQYNAYHFAETIIPRKMDTIDYNKTRTISDTLNSFKNTLILRKTLAGHELAKFTVKLLHILYVL